MNHIEACLEELRAKRDKINECIAGLEAFAAEHRTEAPAPQPPPPAMTKPAKQKRTAKTPKAPKATGLAGAMREVIANINEPFDGPTVSAAILNQRPDLASKLNDGAVRGNLANWEGLGQLIIVEPGRPKHPTKFKRGAKFSADSKLSARETAYRDFRKTIKIPEDPS